MVMLHIIKLTLLLTRPDEIIPPHFAVINGDDLQVGLFDLPKGILLQVLSLLANLSHPHHRYPQADAPEDDQELCDRRR